MDNIVNRFWKRKAAMDPYGFEGASEPYRENPWNEDKTLMMGSMPVTYRSRLKETDFGPEIEVEFSYTEDGQEFNKRSSEPMSAEDQIRELIEEGPSDAENWERDQRDVEQAVERLNTSRPTFYREQRGDN